MVPTDELSPADELATTDLRDVPLTEMSALNADLLWKSIGHVLPDPSTDPVSVAAFQSSI
ncbi:MAG: hypothetical protein ACRDNS_12170 [Trebonia sp.]